MSQVQQAGCTLTMLAGPSDRAFVKDLLLHIFKMSNHDFEEVILVVDDMKNDRIAASARAEFFSTLESLEGRIANLRIVRLSSLDRPSRLMVEILRFKRYTQQS